MAAGYIVSHAGTGEASLAPGKRAPDRANSAAYFTRIAWGGAYERWPLVRFATPMDGNCLFHAIANAYFTPYHAERLDGRYISRDAIVSELRRDLALKLAQRVDLADPASPTHYALLYGGNASGFGDAVPEFSLPQMQAALASNGPLGYGYFEFIGDQLRKDIFVLDAASRDLYRSDELLYAVKGRRPAVVLYYAAGHYELVGLQNGGGFDTHFSPSHPFVLFLTERARALTAASA